MFLCITFIIMISGFGTYFEQEFEINRIIGSAFLSLICFIVFLKNIDSIAKINNIIIPILILTIVILGIKNCTTISVDSIGCNINSDNTYFWIINAIIYASYNLILLIPVLINLNKFIKRQKQIILVSIMTSIIIFVISTLIFLLLVNVDIDFANLEMPVVYVIKNTFNSWDKIYGIIILIAIFTTATSVGISFLNNICKNKKSFPLFVSILCITSLLFVKISFSNLVKIMFPIFGYLGLIQIYFKEKTK